MGKRNWGKRACAVCLLCAATAIALPAQTFTTLHSFDGTDGSNPYAGLVQGSDGNLYGTTGGDGANNYGTVFKITPSGTLTTLYNFCSQTNCTDGGEPFGTTLVQASNGNFYGTTFRGGANDDCAPYTGCGTVFKITPSGTLTTLCSFCSQSGCMDGANPFAPLIQATDGNLYGTTDGGGAYGNNGTVFKITPNGTLTTLYSFCSESGCPDGGGPWGLVQTSDGNFYGTTIGGGANNYGTVFKITPSGTLTTLHSFNGADGSFPEVGLVQATNGNFYGTTFYGGANCVGLGGCGTIFEITPSGTLTTLHNFTGSTGSQPYGVLVQATDGNFYGTTWAGGANDVGTVFRITPSGTLEKLENFDGTDGSYPSAGLVQDTNGKLYGTAFGGGANGDGTVFSLSVGLGPFVETQPTSGKVGAVIKILGTNLTGATSVTFNGTPAVFRVLSRSLIGATIPEGATTGTVQVVTPSGTLSSNVPFRVVP